jgi:hypothetical protein
MASITQERLLSIVVPTSTNIGLSGLAFYKSSNDWRLYSYVYFLLQQVSTTAATGAAF